MDKGQDIPVTEKDGLEPTQEQTDILLRRSSSIPKQKEFPRIAGKYGLYQRKQIQQLSIAHMGDALTNLDTRETQSYFEALTKCPDIILCESTPLNFLLSDNMNAWSAAIRLARYWNERARLFGSAAFSSVLETKGSGTAFHRCFICKTASFAILAIDCTLKEDSLLRELMCLSAAITRDQSLSRESSEPKPIRVLVFGASIPAFTPFLSSLPLPVDQVHAVIDSGDSRETFPYEWHIYHKNQGVVSVLEQLNANGIGSELVPVPIGGSLDSNQLVAFLQAASRKIDPSTLDFSLLPGLKAVSKEAETSSDSRSKESSNEEGQAHNKESTDTEQDKDFIRKRNAMYSRRMYHKRKIENDVLKDQADSLQTANKELKMKNAFLKSLLDQARECVRLYNSFGAPASMPADASGEQGSQHFPPPVAAPTATAPATTPVPTPSHSVPRVPYPFNTFNAPPVQQQAAPQQAPPAPQIPQNLPPDQAQLLLQLLQLLQRQQQQQHQG